MMSTTFEGRCKPKVNYFPTGYTLTEFLCNGVHPNKYYDPRQGSGTGRQNTDRFPSALIKSNEEMKYLSQTLRTYVVRRIFA